LGFGIKLYPNQPDDDGELLLKKRGCCQGSIQDSGYAAVLVAAKRVLLEIRAIIG